MKHIRLFYIALFFTVLLSCTKEPVGTSVFTIEEPESTLLFQYGQQIVVKYIAENLEVFTVKTPAGWKANINDGELVITAPDVNQDGRATSGRVGIYARGIDKEEYAFYIPVRSETSKDLSSCSVVYCSSFSEATPPANLLDEDDFSYWSSADGDKGPFYIILDLGTMLTVSSVGIRARTQGDDIPIRQCAEATIDFATAIRGDGMADLGGKGSGDWNNKHFFFSDKLKNQLFNMAQLRSPASARYVRIGYMKAWLDDGSISTSGISNAMLSGLEIYGY